MSRASGRSVPPDWADAEYQSQWRPAGSGPSPRTVVLTGVAARIGVVLIYALLLHYSYQAKISPVFGYSGLGYRSPERLSYGLALLIVVALAFALPGRIRRASDLVLWIFFITAAAPSILISQYSPTLPVATANTLAFAVGAATVGIRALTARPPRELFPRLKVKPRAFWTSLYGFAALVQAYLLTTAGVEFRFLAFEDVYDVRADYKVAAATAPFLGYLLPAVYNAINPLLVIRGLYQRRAFPLLVGASGQVLIYMATGQKSVLLSTAGVLGFAYLFRRGRELTGSRILLAATAVTSLALILDHLFNSIVWTSLFVRRFLVLPGVLTGAYVMVYDILPRAGFGTDPSGLVPAQIVGRVFFGSSTANANASLFGHGYALFGYDGIFIESLLLVLLLWAADDLTRDLPVPVASLMFLMPAITISNGSVFTSILTTGFGATLVLSATVPVEGWRLAHPPHDPFNAAGRRRSRAL